jgi:tagatose-1,6-bisphosphate aldolase
MNLKSLATEQGLFTLLATDQLVAIADRTGLTLSRPMPSENHNQIQRQATQFPQAVAELLQVYSQAVSGVGVVPEISFDQVGKLFESIGVYFPLERRLFDTDPLSVPILSQNWGVEAIRNNYSVAKLELFFNPTEREAAAKKQLVAEVYDYCQHQGIDLILEVLVYMEGSEHEYQQQFPELQLGAVQELRTLCSLMALEYPLNALGAVTITAELDVPWVVSLRNTPYPVAKEQLRTALESGARGFLALEQFLPEKPEAGSPTFDQAQFSQFVRTIGRDRVVELSRIVAESQTQESAR